MSVTNAVANSSAKPTNVSSRACCAKSLSFSCTSAVLDGTKFSKMKVWICCPKLDDSGNNDNTAYDTVISGTTANNVEYVSAAALFMRPCAPNCATMFDENHRT